MKPEWLPAMKDAISEVLETMFFVVVDFNDASCPSATPCSYQSSIDLVSPRQGLKLLLRLTTPFVRSVAATFLGKGEEEMPEEELQDVVKELTNMVAGVFKAHIDDSSAAWHLGIPCCETPCPPLGNPPVLVSMLCTGTHCGDAILETISPAG